MFGSDSLSTSAVEAVAHTIQVALTPIFLLSGIASLLSVFAGRLSRVADRVDELAERADRAEPRAKAALEKRLAYLRRRSHTLDIAVALGAVAGAATCSSVLILFVGTLRDLTVTGLLISAFALALICTIGALSAFLLEMLMASRGIRHRSITRSEPEPNEMADSEPEGHAHETAVAADAGPAG